jgi:ribosomal protein L18E
MEQFLTTVIPGLLIAIITSVVTVRLSINQFYSQKWWERKWDEYRSMVDALHDLRNHSQIEVSKLDSATKISAERRQALVAHAREGYEVLTRAISIGSFVFSATAIDVLEELQASLIRLNLEEMGAEAFLDARIRAFDQAIGRFIPLARKDLAAR